MSVSHVKPSDRTTIRTAGQGFLEIYHSSVGDLPVLHVEGSPEEMGFQIWRAGGGARAAQHGPYRRDVRGRRLPDALVHVLLDKAWLHLAPHTPERYLRENGGDRGRRAIGGV